MGQCHTCGNLYDHSFEVIVRNNKYVFDSFECAIHALVPACNHCQCRVDGFDSCEKPIVGKIVRLHCINERCCDPIC